jgi:hypothetical protein
MRLDDTRAGTTAVGLAPASLATLAGLAFLVGLAENDMHPFQSPVYCIAAALTYAVSAKRGLRDGLFLACGFVNLLLLSSVFRDGARTGAFLAELPLDLCLFFSLGLLPAATVEIYSGDLRALEQEKLELKVKIRDLSARLAEAGERRKAEAERTAAGAPDEAAWNRRGVLVADAVKAMATARSLDQVVDAMATALDEGLAPEAFFLARADADGTLRVARARLADPTAVAAGGPGAPLESQETAPVLAELVRSGRPILRSPATGEPALAGGLPSTLLVPLLSNRRLVALAGLAPAAPATGPDALAVATILAHVASEVCARFGIGEQGNVIR